MDTPQKATLTRSNRKTERKSVATEARLRSGMSRCVVDVADISATGIRLRTADPLREGEHVWITLPSLQPLEVRVVWFRNWEAGCEFVNPLHPAVADTIAARSR